MSFIGTDALPLMIVTLFITYFYYCYFYYKCYYYHSYAPICTVNNGINRHLRNGGHMEKIFIAPYSQVHDNFTMGVNRKNLINLIYLFIQETYLTCANGL